MLKIVGGRWKGRKLASPTGSATRPTSEALRETLFNVLAHRFSHEPQRVLDLFAGTGALALEALSHGACCALLFESDRRALECLRRNFQELSAEEVMWHAWSSPRIEKWGDSLRAYAQEKPDCFPLDTIFCDPPYEKNLIPRALESLRQASVELTPDCLLVCELSSREKAPLLEAWELVDERRRGATGLLFYRRRG